MISYKSNVNVLIPAYILVLTFNTIQPPQNNGRSFNENGPGTLLDQIKDVAHTVLDNKNILTKYDH